MAQTSCKVRFVAICLALMIMLSLSSHFSKYLSSVGLSVTLAVCVMMIGRSSTTPSLLLLIALLGLAAVVISGEVRRVLLAVAILDTPLEWDKYYFYREPLGELGAIGGYGIGLTTICLVGLYALWLVNWLHNPRERYRKAWRVAWPLLLYVGTVGLSVFAASDPTLSLYEIWLLFQTLLLFLYVVANTRGRGEITFLVGVLLVGLLLESGLTFIGMAAGSDGMKVAGLKMDVDHGRASGTLGSPNTLSSYLVPLLILALSVFTARQMRLKWLAALALTGGSIALVLTQSRGGWVAFMISLLIWGAIALHRRWVPIKLVGIGLLGSLGVVAATGGIVIERLTSTDNGAAYSRLPLMRLTWRMIQDRPIFGLGANQYALRLNDYLPGSLAHEWLYTVHNKYLLVWAENGVIGLLAFLTLLAVFMWRSWRVANSACRYAPLGLALFAALIGQSAHMFTDVFHSRPQVQSLWLLGAFASVLYLESQTEWQEVDA